MDDKISEVNDRLSDATDDISRRRLLQAGAVGSIGAAGAIGATAGCVDAIAKEIKCRTGKPTTFTFAPATPLDEVDFERDRPDLPTNESNETESNVTDKDLNLNRLVGVLSRRARVAMDYNAIPQIKGVEVLDSGKTSFEFGEHINDTEIVTYILASTGEYELRIEDADGNETTLFTATGEYIRRGARAQQLSNSGSDSSNTESDPTDANWIAAIPLGPQEAKDIQSKLREENVAEAPSEYTFYSYFYGEEISSEQLPQEGVDQLLSEDWDNVLPISDLSKKQAVGLVAHCHSQKPPVDIDVTTNCRSLDHRVSDFSNSNSGTDDENTSDTDS